MQASEVIRLPLPTEIREKALALCRSGMSCRATAGQLHLPLGTVKAWLYRQRKKNSLAQQQLAKVETAIVPAESDEPIEIPDTLPERQEFFVERTSAAAVKLAAHISKLDGEALVKGADKLHKAIQSARTSLKLDLPAGNQVIQIGVLIGPQTKDANVALRNRKQ